MQGHWFSDCVTFTSDPTSRGLRNVLAEVHYLYGFLIHHRALVLRGSVVKGQLYEEGGILFGPALVEAHSLESKKAKYPRVILSEGIGRAEELASLKTGDTPMRCFTFTHDRDGEVYLDPIRSKPTWPPIEHTSEELYASRAEWLRRFRAVARDGLDKTKGTTRAKYVWMAVRFNEAVDAVSAEGLDPLKLSRTDLHLLDERGCCLRRILP